MAENSVSHEYIFQKLLEQGRSPKDGDSYIAAIQSEVLNFFGLSPTSLTDDASKELKCYADKQFHKQLLQFYSDHKSRVTTIKRNHRVR